MVSPIVDIESVEHVRNPETSGMFDGRAIKLRLAKITAVYRICSVARIVKFMSFHEQVGCSKPLSQLLCVGPLLQSKARGDCR